VGDTVVSINGKIIKNTEDVVPFMSGAEKIESIEVAHE